VVLLQSASGDLCMKVMIPTYFEILFIHSYVACEKLKVARPIIGGEFIKGRLMVETV
jgi:hypothetical protein